MPGYAHTFTIDEAKWLSDTYMQTFLACERGDPVPILGSEPSSMESFLKYVVDDFRTHFPYRHPETPEVAIPVNYRSLNLTSYAQWEALGKEIHGLLKFLKRRDIDNIGVTCTFQNDPVAAKPEETVTSTPADPGPDEQALEKPYGPRADDIKRWGRLVLDLDNVGKRSWADALCVSDQCPGPVVTGNPDCQGYPILPEGNMTRHQYQRTLHDYFSAVFQWQGGDGNVPYALIERNAQTQKLQVVSPAALPEGVTSLKDPMAMSDEELGIWGTHILTQQKESATLGVPSLFDESWLQHNYQRRRDTRPPGSRVYYGPDALAYKRFIDEHSTYKQPERLDGLPTMDYSAAVQWSITDSDNADHRSVLGATDPGIELLDLIREHDNCLPPHAGPRNWEQRIGVMPHLKKTLPAAGITSLLG
ncbi:hypothetical protein RSAG8_13131, partial [Rhizoctonia solani AG-8 WAC10335]